MNASTFFLKPCYCCLCCHESEFTLHHIKSSSCIDSLIIFYFSFTINLTKSLVQQNLDMEEEFSNFSTHVSLYLEKYGFFDLLWSLTKGVGFPDNYFSAISYIVAEPRI